VIASWTASSSEGQRRYDMTLVEQVREGLARTLSDAGRNADRHHGRPGHARAGARGCRAAAYIRRVILKPFRAKVLLEAIAEAAVSGFPGRRRPGQAG
jgi:hypothetical protein